MKGLSVNRIDIKEIDDTTTCYNFLAWDKRVLVSIIDDLYSPYLAFENLSKYLLDRPYRDLYPFTKKEVILDLNDRLKGLLIENTHFQTKYGNSIFTIEHIAGVKGYVAKNLLVKFLEDNSHIKLKCTGDGSGRRLSGDICINEYKIKVTLVNGMSRIKIYKYIQFKNELNFIEVNNVNIDNKIINRECIEEFLIKINKELIDKRFRGFVDNKREDAFEPLNLEDCNFNCKVTNKEIIIKLVKNKVRYIYRLNYKLGKIIKPNSNPIEANLIDSIFLSQSILKEHYGLLNTMYELFEKIEEHRKHTCFEVLAKEFNLDVEKTTKERIITLSRGRYSIITTGTFRSKPTIFEYDSNGMRRKVNFVKTSSGKILEEDVLSWVGSMFKNYQSGIYLGSSKSKYDKVNYETLKMYSSKHRHKPTQNFK